MSLAKRLRSGAMVETKHPTETLKTLDLADGLPLRAPPISPPMSETSVKLEAWSVPETAWSVPERNTNKDRRHDTTPLAITLLRKHV